MATIKRGIPPNKTAVNPSYLLKPEVLLVNVLKLKNISAVERDTIHQKFNDKLKDEIRGVIGDTSVSMHKAVEKNLAKLNFLEVKDTDISVVLKKHILTEFGENKTLAKEASKIISSLETKNIGKVKDLIHLETPIKNNPLFSQDILTAKLSEYCKILNLDKKTENKLLEINIQPSNIDSFQINQWVKEGIIAEDKKAQMALTFNLGNLTDDNFNLIRAIKSPVIQSAKDFVSLEKRDWEKIIREEKIPLPEGETIKSFADNIHSNLEMTFPSEFIMKSAVHKDNYNKLKSLDAVHSLLANNDILLNGKELSPITNWSGISIDKRKSLENNLSELNAFANSYNALELKSLINDKNLSLENKKKKIKERLDSLKVFNSNNPDLDLTRVNFFDKKNDTLKWDNITKENKPRVLKQIMTYQRILKVANNTEDRMLLLSRGYYSSMSIASEKATTFIKNSGLSAPKAKIYYNKASQLATETTVSYNAIRDILKGSFNKFPSSNFDYNLFNDLNDVLTNDLMNIDNLEALFGSLDYCDCGDCVSIFSPAAYFTDLMYFIEDNISNPVFVNVNPPKTDHPLYLKNRRSDLWKVQLNCENTFTLIPYLIIVNDVLENYLKSIVNGDIYEKLSNKNERSTVNLPFNLPLEELRIYLSYFEISLFEIYKFKNVKNKWLAKLNLSREEFDLITKPDQSVIVRFGNHPQLNNFPVNDQQNPLTGELYRGFINYAGITRDQLDELLKITFQPSLQNLKIEKITLPGEIQNFPEVLKNLDRGILDFIDKFLRLQKKSGLSIPDLALILISLQKAMPLVIKDNINGAVIENLAKWLDIKDKLNLNVEDLCSMIYLIPVSSDFPLPSKKLADKKLYERLFDLLKIFGEKDLVTHEINQEVIYHHYSFNTVNVADNSIDQNTSQLLSGLGINETELLQLFSLLNSEIVFDQNGDCKLTRKEISLLYRHARLAKILKYSIDDFIKMMLLRFDYVPVIVNSGMIDQLIEFSYWQKTSGFKVSELRFILQGVESSEFTYSITLDFAIQLVLDVKSSTETDKIKAQQQSLSKNFNLSLELIENILKWVDTDLNDPAIQDGFNAKFTNGVPDTPADLDKLIEYSKKIELVKNLITKLKFTPETIDFITSEPKVFGKNSMQDLSIEDIYNLSFYKSQIEISGDAASMIQPVLKNYESSHSFNDDNISSISNLFKLETSFVSSFCNSLSFSFIPIKAFRYLKDGINYGNILGINGYSLDALSKDDNYSVLIHARDIVLGAIGAKYDNDIERATRLEPCQDKINSVKRDALCDYIIGKEKKLKFRDRNEIYSFFLLDVEMGGCFRTSKLVCAISSIQLYVFRCLLNLEQSATDGLNVIDENYISSYALEELKHEWEWRKNYRVWETNRRVFVYPESYIDPDLRDNKTPEFKELEDELLQEKITKAAAQTAYQKYLSQFSQLARLLVVGCYRYQPDTLSPEIYFFFGRTNDDPPQYFYRKWIDRKTWTSWEKIELAIHSESVSALIYFGRLYLFWTEVKSVVQNSFTNGNSYSYYNYKMVLNYSYLNENNKWVTPQKKNLNNHPSDTHQDLTETGDFKINNICFPWSVGPDNSKIDILFYYSENIPPVSQFQFNIGLDLINNQLIPPFSLPQIISGNIDLIGLKKGYQNSLQLVKANPTVSLNMNEAEWDYNIDDVISSSYSALTSPIDPLQGSMEMHVVQHHYGDAFLRIGNQQYILTKGGGWSTTLINTSIVDQLIKQILTKGLDKFLSLTTQTFKEDDLPFTIIDPSHLGKPVINTEHIDFKGSYGDYYKELFFDIPFSTASSLNADLKFEDANWWYEKIFNPTAPESSVTPNKSDRVWQFIEFRGLNIQKLKDALSDVAAIEQYKTNPFNPFAIARLRISAFQKTIVMHYIDNLLDWADDLFTSYKMETLNEATMLYVLAQEILGRRPVKTGKCETPADEKMTYENIGPSIQQGSEILIWLESVLVNNNFKVTALNQENSFSANLIVSGKIANTSVMNYNFFKSLKEDENKKEAEWVNKNPDNRNHGNEMTRQIVKELVFCVPPNKKLLDYYDRVEDRLRNLRNCMTINGERTPLALFDPEIDPMLLIRAKAEGISIDELLQHQSEELPPYRFTFLVEKAKQFAQTVQSFGSALLSALEKKDVEELTKLRSVHESNILRITTDIKKKNIKEAQRQNESLVEARKNVINRVNYYSNLIADGLTGWETTQQISRHTATILHSIAGEMHLTEAICALIPNLGSPFAITYGGEQLGKSFEGFADWLSKMAIIAEAISASAGLEASFQRRSEEWKQQLLLANQESKQMDKQILASEIRVQIAEKDLEIHQKNIDQAEELDEFYKNKFTNLGLYNYLSTTLNRLYRQVYFMAWELARKAQITYKFERDDETDFIAKDNWQFDRAGLLAGESLMTQLGQMESDYLLNNKRDQEINQSFSLIMLDPSALLSLKHTGSCTFYIPEVAFDVFYPGQYHRLIKSVRVTVPGIVGPYTNVSAKLALLDSSVRKKDKLTINPQDIEQVSYDYTNATISTSSAQNDSGMFEFNFRDERYLPFEGSGAINSKWKLELPSKLRPFNYNTISDVIIHLSYTAKDNKDGGIFKDLVETNIINTISSSDKLIRLISLKQEFSNNFYQLLNPELGKDQFTEFFISIDHFPYFFNDKNIDLKESVFYLKPSKGMSIATCSIEINKVINAVKWKAANDIPSPNVLGEVDKIKGGTFNPGGKIYLKNDFKLSIKVNQPGFDKDALDDILILLNYEIT